MFVYILLAVLAGFGIHVAVEKDRSVRRIGEIGLLWLLVGYCGVATLGYSLMSLVHAHEMAELQGFAPDSPFQDFMSVAFLGMSIVSLLALRYRGTFLIGPAVGWIVFWTGATFVHLAEVGASAGHGHATVLFLFATHGLVAVLLAAALAASGVMREQPNGGANRVAPPGSRA